MVCRCIRCGFEYESVDRVAPTHDWPRQCRRVCAGSKQVGVIVVYECEPRAWQTVTMVSDDRGLRVAC